LTYGCFRRFAPDRSRNSKRCVKHHILAARIQSTESRIPCRLRLTPSRQRRNRNSPQILLSFRPSDCMKTLYRSRLRLRAKCLIYNEAIPFVVSELVLSEAEGNHERNFTQSAGGRKLSPLSQAIKKQNWQKSKKDLPRPLEMTKAHILSPEQTAPPGRQLRTQR
jgi:hypothetical protein